MKRTLPLLLLGSALVLLAGCSTLPTLDTPLIKAAHEGRPGTIAALLKDGARPDEPDSHGLTSLGWAARGGHPLRPHRCTPQDEAHIQAIRALLEGGAGLDIRNENGWTPLMVAIHHKQPGAALALIDAGAAIDVSAGSGMTALKMAEVEGLLDVVAALKARGARVSSR